jgi:AraC-like DNA-binding protein
MEILRESDLYDLFCCTKTYKGSSLYHFHWHENYEICQPLDNPCSFRIDGEIINANPGDIVAISEQTVHQFIIGSNDTRIRIVQFKPNILLGLTERVRPLRTHIPYSEIHENPEIERQLNCIFTLMEHEKYTERYKTNIYFKSLTASLYFFLQQHFQLEGQHSSRNSSKYDFYRMVEYINTNFTENLTVNSISAHFYFSRGKVASVFKKYSGMTVNEYVNRLRIKRANILLANGESITNAALYSGFESIRTFNNNYKKIMGKTPREYINEN